MNKVSTATLHMKYCKGLECEYSCGVGVLHCSVDASSPVGGVLYDQIDAGAYEEGILSVLVHLLFIFSTVFVHIFACPDNLYSCASEDLSVHMLLTGMLPCATLCSPLCVLTEVAHWASAYYHNYH
jgi:hypothetical protein